MASNIDMTSSPLFQHLYIVPMYIDPIIFEYWDEHRVFFKMIEAYMRLIYAPKCLSIKKVQAGIK